MGRGVRETNILLDTVGFGLLPTPRMTQRNETQTAPTCQASHMQCKTQT